MHSRKQIRSLARQVSTCIDKVFRPVDGPREKGAGERCLTSLPVSLVLLTACVGLILGGCGGGGTSAVPGGTAAVTPVPLNDTGITTWGNATANNLTSTQTAFPGQDADHGRDALAMAGKLTKVGGSSNANQGFDFTKLDATGAPLADQKANYTNTPWSCVKDNVTGLTWEVKTTVGAGGLRDANYTYTWYNSTGVNDGGNSGTANGGTCVNGADCDTEKYVAAVNAAGLCGYTDWRLPKKEELRSIVDYSNVGSSFDTGYFPNTKTTAYWSASPSGNAANAWDVFFFGGFDGAYNKSNSDFVRLVRGGQ